jgi:nucleoside-diphosphate-sugar epimerase
MSRRFLVTGGAGFLGSALVHRLVRDGQRVRVLDDGSRGRAERLADVRDAIEYVPADVRDAEAVGRACAGVDVVCHLAAVNGTVHFYERPDLVLDVAVRGVLNVLDGCRRHDVGELLLASSSEVYQTPPTIPTGEDVPLVIPDPRNPRYSYAAGKLIGEMLLLHAARHLTRAVVFRPHNVYGPDMGREHVIPELVLRVRALARTAADPLQLPIQGTGAETRAFVFVNDFTDGLARLIARGEHLDIYNIGTTDEITIAQVARQVGACLGRMVTVVPGPPAEGGTPRRCPDVHRLAALGWAPRVSFSEGLARTVAWYVEHEDLQETG